MAVKPHATSPAEAMTMAADRRNYGFRLGMELGSKVFHYDASGDMDYCIWTVTVGGVAVSYRQNYTYDVSHRITDSSEWFEL